MLFGNLYYCVHYCVNLTIIIYFAFQSFLNWKWILKVSITKAYKNNLPWIRLHFLIAILLRPGENIYGALLILLHKYLSFPLFVHTTTTVIFTYRYHFFCLNILLWIVMPQIIVTIVIRKILFVNPASIRSSPNSSMPQPLLPHIWLKSTPLVKKW